MKNVKSIFITYLVTETNGLAQKKAFLLLSQNSKPQNIY